MLQQPKEKHAVFVSVPEEHERLSKSTSFPITAHHGGMSHQQAFTATIGILEHVLSLRRLLRLRAAGWGHLSNGNPTAGGCERNKPVAAPRELDAHFNSSHLILPTSHPAAVGQGGPGDKAMHTCGSGVHGSVPVCGN